MSEPGARPALGRGLAALLRDSGEQAEGVTPQASVRDVPLDHLRPNPAQPRKTFAEDELQQLADSISAKGILQPLLVCPDPQAPGRYQIVAGERRWRAARLAGAATAPVVVRTDLTELDLLEIGVIENVQREDLKPLEEAGAYRTLIDQFGRTQEDVAKAVGKSRSHVANALRLLSLPPFALGALGSGQITAGHARAIAAGADPDALAQSVIAKGLTVRQAEALARTTTADVGRRAAPRRRASKTEDVVALEQDLTETLGFDVDIAVREGRGSLRIDFSSLEELDKLCQRLSR